MNTTSVSALVLTLAPDVEAIDGLLAWLARDERVDVGQLNGPRLPLSFIADLPGEERRFWQSLEAHPAVTMCQLVMVHYDDPPGADPDAIAETVS